MKYLQSKICKKVSFSKPKNEKRAKNEPPEEYSSNSNISTNSWRNTLIYTSKNSGDIRFYDIVKKIPYEKLRPVVILGLTASKMISRLVHDHSEYFQFCPISTTSKLLNSDYVHVCPSEMEMSYNQDLYIEFYISNGDFYGIHVNDVNKIVSEVILLIYRKNTQF
ncbi:hypothetical protein RF11_11248 [Thelohanellus kitauei]|uniref:Uncharacterized protein n=1 Tax=Thelohanellus kitauei TaxID=669202 RepID=A0A0C2MJ76_THEKT|nr:hypothetical protein RF11_11248 [Thelohanellus kitauei]